MIKRCMTTHLSTSCAVLLVVLTALADGQDGPPARSHVYLPPTRGATVTSTYIDSQAHLILAMGDYVESAAIARRHGAEALDKQLDNSIKWVETYFKRRELNRAYRQKENPSYLDKVEDREQVADRRIRDLPSEVMQGDVTGELNTMLDDIANASMAYEAIHGSQSVYEDSEIDQKLSKEDIEHVILTDGGQKYGQKLTFRASDAEVFNERWPLALRAPEMQSAREYYWRLCEQALNEIQTSGSMNYETFQEMQNALDALAGLLVRKYPPQYRKDAPPQVFLEYYAAERFLKSQVLAVRRAMNTTDTGVFDGSNRFTGDSVIDLIRHMSRRGLNFSKPHTGDEPTYERLFVAMRRIYQELCPEG